MPLYTRSSVYHPCKIFSSALAHTNNSKSVSSSISQQGPACRPIIPLLPAVLLHGLCPSLIHCYTWLHFCDMCSSDVLLHKNIVATWCVFSHRTSNLGLKDDKYQTAFQHRVGACTDNLCLPRRFYFASHLDPGTQVYAPTFPGYGRSEKQALAYSQELWRDFLRDFVLEVVGRPVVIAGNSIGGFISASLAADYPSLVKGEPTCSVRHSSVVQF